MLSADAVLVPVSHNEDACRLYGKAFVQSVFENPKRNKNHKRIEPALPLNERKASDAA